MIKQLDIGNLTVFVEAKLRFGRHLNVIVGENGSGKTHLLCAPSRVPASKSSSQPTAFFSCERSRSCSAPGPVPNWTPVFFGLHLSSEGVAVEQGRSPDDIGDIAALDEELAQSDRFLAEDL